MASLSNEIKTFFLKGLEAIGDAAASVSASAKQKLDLMRLESRRDELRRELPAAALEMWKEGFELPQKLRELIEELNDLNAQLAAVKAKPAKEETANEEPAQANPASFEEAIDDLEDKVEDAWEAVEDFAEAKAEQLKDSVKEKFSAEKEETFEPITMDEPGENE